MIVGISALLLLTAAYLWVLGGPPRAIGGPFQLIETDGKAVTQRSFAGRYMLVYFGYASCPDICPTTLNAMAGALDQLGARSDLLQLLFITVDPQRDTPDTLRQYLAGFSPRLIGLTGTPDELRRVEQEYHATAKARADTTIEHSAVLYLMGPTGNFVAPIRADASATEIADAVARHMS